MKVEEEIARALYALESIGMLQRSNRMSIDELVNPPMESENELKAGEGVENESSDAQDITKRRTVGDLGVAEIN